MNPDHRYPEEAHFQGTEEERTLREISELYQLESEERNSVKTATVVNSDVLHPAGKVTFQTC